MPAEGDGRVPEAATSASAAPAMLRAVQREMSLGVLTGVVAVILAALGPVWLFVALAVVGVLGAGEAFAAARARGLRPLPAVGLGGVVLLLATGYARGERAPEALPIVLAAWTLVALTWMLARSERVQVVRSLAATLAPVLAVGFLGSYALALRGSRDGLRVFLALFLMALAADLAGRLAAGEGARALAPAFASRISRDGVAAGVVAAVVVAIIARPVLDLPMSGGSALILALLVGIATPAGELAAGMVTRSEAVARARQRAAPPPESPITEPVWLTEPVPAVPAPEPPAAGDRPPPHPVPVLDRLGALLAASPVFFYAFRVLER